MNRVFRFWTLACLILLAAGVANAESFQLNDGTRLTGELVSPNENGVLVRLPDDSYSDRVPWAKFSQADIQKLAENPKLRPFVEPFIEVPEEEIARKKEITIKPVTRLERPAAASFLGGFAASSVGLTILFLLYLANLYAAYEVSVVRAQSPALVCGTAAVLPVIGPILFLCLPTKMKTRQQEEAELAAARHAAEAATAATAQQSDQQAAAVGVALREMAPELPATQLFKRGEFVFNRRFFETKFAGFFGIVRREADKDLVLTIKSVRGLFGVERFTRITGNEMFVLTQKGGASQEVVIPFAEVQEVELRHKDVPGTLGNR